MKKYITVLCFLISSSSIALELPGDDHYVEDCFFSGWNCDELSREEKSDLLDIFREELKPFSDHIEKNKDLNFRHALDKSIYRKAAGICKNIYLLDPTSKDCDELHCAYMKSKWRSDKKIFNEEYKKECK